MRGASVIRDMGSWLTTTLVLLGVLGLLYAWRVPLLRRVGGLLVVEDPTDALDAVVLLNGGMSTRPYRARDLYREQRVPVLLARLADTEEIRLGVIPNISDATAELLRRLGVAPEHLCVASTGKWVAGTRDEAVVLCALIRERGYHRVALVTDAFHTRRARRIFRDVANDPSLEFLAVSSRFTAAVKDGWWRSQYGFVQVFTEYLKFVHYFYTIWWHRASLPATESDLPPADPVRRMVAGVDK